MSKLVKLKLAIIFLLILQVSYSQERKFVLQLSDSSVIKKKHKTFNDSLLLINYLDKYKNRALLKAHLDASFNKIIWKDTVFAEFNLGKKYFWGNIKLNNKNTSEVMPIFSLNNLKSNKLNVKKLENNLEQTLKHFENNGYPFTKISLDSVEIKNNIVNASIKIEKGKLILIDSLNNKGNSNISIKFLNCYLDIKNGETYNEKKIIAIDKRLKNLNFVTLSKPTEILFYKENVAINIFADKNKINKFDGIIGVVPNDKTTGKLAVTGELNIFLKNSLNRAETIIVEWQKTESESQKLNLEFQFPYIFNTIVGINALLNLLKQDTSFLNVRARGGLDFLLYQNKSITAFVENKTSNLLSITQFQNATVLPPYADTKINLYGLSILSKNFNRAFAPTKGYILFLEVALGNKIIVKNSKLPQELYQNIQLSSIQIEAKFNSEAYLKISKNINFKLRLDAVYIDNNKLFLNELYRFGGLKTLRGFNEAEIYANFATTSTIQLNFYYEEFSNFFIFTDAAYYENKVNGFVCDTPIGIGVGTNFSTKAGIFTVSYALGKQFNNTFQFNSARIHIGYISIF